MDIFPQPAKFELALTAAAEDSLGNELRFPLTLAARETETQAIVTEIVAVKYDTGGLKRDLAFATMTAAASAFFARTSLTFRAATAAENDENTGTMTIGDVNVLDIQHVGTVGAWTAAGSTLVDVNEVEVHDLTMGTGVGRLIPGDRIFINCTHGTVASAHTLGIEVFYRQHMVGFREFRGILASLQQNPT